MAGSTLDPDNIPQGRKRKTQKGHDVASLGPSDSSDSGSDMKGPGLVGDDALRLDRGTNEDAEAGTVGKIEAGAAVGDREMDDTSDRSGTGERLSAGKEPRMRPDGDRGVDRVVNDSEAGLGDGLDQAEEARRGKMDEQIEREKKP